MTKHIGPWTILIAALLAAACNSSPVDSQGSNVRVYLTDAPIDLTGVTGVVVTVDSLTLYPMDEASGDGGAVPLTGGPVSAPGGFEANLLDFRNGKVTILGTGEIPAGTYQRIRLEISSAVLTRDDDGDPATPDTREDIFIPSGKVDVPLPITVAAGEALDVTLDFDAGASVQVNSTNGQNAYILRPVITPAGTQAGSTL